MNVFCSDLITKVLKWNYYIFMQIDYQRWPPRTVTNNSINTKMTISQDLLVEFDPALCQNVSCMNLLYFYAPVTIVRGHLDLLLSVCLSVRPFVTLYGIEFV